MQRDLDVGTLAAVVDARDAEALLRELLSLGLVDRTLRIRKRGPEIVIPLRAEPDVAVGLSSMRVEWVRDAVARVIPRSPRNVLRERFREANIPEEFVPKHWERIGDVVVVRIPPRAGADAEEIGQIVGEVLRARTVVEDVSGVHGPFRTPEMRVLWGNGTETIHVEGGIRYALDVARVMFSSGNVAERLRSAEGIRPGSVVVDLFAGIGYFAVPIAVRSAASKVYACEMNPVAYEYLLETVRLNRATRVVPLLGDCRDTAPVGVADRVVMGHFSASSYLDVAFRSILDSGTVVYHHVGPRDQFPGVAIRRIRKVGSAAGFSVRSHRSRRVKSYAPEILHGVVETVVRRE